MFQGYNSFDDDSVSSLISQKSGNVFQVIKTEKTYKNNNYKKEFVF